MASIDQTIVATALPAIQDELQERYGIAPLGAGTLLTARVVGMISVAGLAVLALRRTGYRLPMAGGFLILAGAWSRWRSPRRCRRTPGWRWRPA